MHDAKGVAPGPNVVSEQLLLLLLEEGRQQAPIHHGGGRCLHVRVLFVWMEGESSTQGGGEVHDAEGVAPGLCLGVVGEQLLLLLLKEGRQQAPIHHGGGRCLHVRVLFVWMEGESST